MIANGTKEANELVFGEKTTVTSFHFQIFVLFLWLQIWWRFKQN